MATFYDYQKNILSSGGGGGEGFSSSSAQLLNGDDICEGFAIDKFGNPQTHSSFGCTSFISCKGAKKMSITRIVTSSSPGEYGLAFYDEGKGFLSFVPSMAGSNGFELSEISIPNDAVWFKATYWNYDKSLMYGSFSCEVESADVVNNKRPYQDGMIFFSKAINQSCDKWWNNSSYDEPSLPYTPKATTGVLMLPNSYRSNGTPTKIIMYCHGFGSWVNYGHWGKKDGDAQDDYLRQKENWLNMGFAVMDCNGAKDTFAGSGANNFATAPQNASAYIKCFEFIREHYNVEDKFYIVGASMGGQPCLQICYSYPNMIKACGLLSPHCSCVHWFETSPPTPAIEMYGGSLDYESYPERFVGYFHDWRILTIDNKPTIPSFPPTKLIYTTSDPSDRQAQMVAFITALRNGGNVANMRRLTNITHAKVASGGVIELDEEIGNFFNQY